VGTRERRTAARARGAARTGERAIEISWCFSRYRGEPRLLDVGYAFAKPAYLAAVVALGASASRRPSTSAQPTIATPALASGGIDEALKELRRVGGRVLITVPCGEPGDYGWFVQDEPDGWRQRFRDAGFLVFEDELYELTSDGWRSASADAAAEARYGERGPGASAVLCAELHPRTPSNRLREAIRRRRPPTPE
jgi:hypothetical protein